MTAPDPLPQHLLHEVVFTHAGAAWQVLVIVLLAAAVAALAWRRYGPTAPGRIGSVARAARSLALALVVLAAAGPAWRTTRISILPGKVVVAIDRSASMARPDAPGGRPRIALASDLAAQLEAVAGPRQLVVDYRSMGGVAGPIDASRLAAGPLSAPGTSSPLADDLAHLVAEERPDALIVVSDGRVTQGSSLAALPALWRDRDLEVAILATGSDVIEPELLIDEVVINRQAALGEREPIAVRLSERALHGAPVTVTATVENQPPHAVTVPVPAAVDQDLHGLEAHLDAVFTDAGPAHVHIHAAQGAVHADQDLTVTVSKRSLRVLMLAQRPRYEMRYLREAFRRDRTVTLHAYLADGRWRRWDAGSSSEAGPSDHLPLTPDELRDYDVVIIGDLGPDAFTDSELTALDQAVRQGGTGLVWIPGETGAIAGFSDQKLGGLIPAELPDAATISRGYLDNAEHRLSRTAIAADLGLLDAGDQEWQDLPPLYGAAPVGTIKPPAEVLVEDQQHAPIVVTRPYGAGRALLIAVDDTWRWRRTVGDLYLHRFHSQLLRYVAAGRHLGDHEWRLFPAPRRSAPGDLVTVSLVPTATAAEAAIDHATIRLTPASAATGAPPPDAAAEILVRLTPREGGGFSARFPAPSAGIWNLGIADGPDPAQVDSDQLLVIPAIEELRDPRVDLAALQDLARATGGQVFRDPAALVAALGDLRHSESLSSLAGWWDTWPALLALIGLLALDWGIRRRHRLP